MLFTLSNPLYNTVIVFLSIMALIYIYKPDAIYDREKKEFRQFGIDDGKTLMPIYVIAILMAIIIYVLFNQIARITTSIDTENNSNSTIKTTIHNLTEPEPELSSLRTQMALMNHNIAQLNQMNQMNQLSQIHQINHQLAKLQLNQNVGRSHNSIRHIDRRTDSINNSVRGYDTSGIYKNRTTMINGSNGSDGSDRSILSRSVKSIDADNIVNSVLASTRPSTTNINSYSNSASRNSSTILNNTNRYDSSGGNRAILPNNFSI